MIHHRDQAGTVMTLVDLVHVEDPETEPGRSGETWVGVIVEDPADCSPRIREKLAVGSLNHMDCEAIRRTERNITCGREHL
jgi:hypothetical protein